MPFSLAFSPKEVSMTLRWSNREASMTPRWSRKEASMTRRWSTMTHRWSHLMTHRWSPKAVNAFKAINKSVAWDVLGSPAKLWQMRRNIFLNQIWRKRANYKNFMPNIYKKLCHVGLYIAKKIFSRESCKFFMQFYKKVCRFGLYIAKIKRELTEHFIMSYVPFPRANQYQRDTVVHFQGIRMFHILNRKKLLPSFNIGIILALVQSVVMSFCCHKGKNAGQNPLIGKIICTIQIIAMLFMLPLK